MCQPGKEIRLVLARRQLEELQLVGVLLVGVDEPVEPVTGERGRQVERQIV
jgi:hypothetical protein